MADTYETVNTVVQLYHMINWMLSHIHIISFNKRLDILQFPIQHEYRILPLIMTI